MPHQTSSPQLPYQSLPALDQQMDLVERDLQEMSESVDALYDQEEKEMEFLDSFIDYDSISINSDKSFKRCDKRESSTQTKEVKTLPQIMSGSVLGKQRHIKERFKSLSKKSFSTVPRFDKSDNLQHMKEGFKKSRERLSTVFSSMRTRSASYDWISNPNSVGHNCRT